MYCKPTFPSRIFRKNCLHFSLLYAIINFVAGYVWNRRRYATVVQLVVRHLAKVEVAGSSPVCRSKNTEERGMYGVLVLCCNHFAPIHFLISNILHHIFLHLFPVVFLVKNCRFILFLRQLSSNYNKKISFSPFLLNGLSSVC